MLTGESHCIASLTGLSSCQTRMRGIYTSLALLGLAAAAQARVVEHDSSFTPDHVLRVTAGTWSEACDERHSVLVNGSVPGPDLRLREGELNWIRVYNDMTDANTTMVSLLNEL